MRPNVLTFILLIILFSIYFVTLLKIEVMLERLRDILKDRGLTLKAFSDISGISQPNLSNYINGNISPTLDTLDKIAKSLNLEIQDLFPQRDRVEIFAKVNDRSYRITEQDILQIIKTKDGSDQNK